MPTCRATVLGRSETRRLFITDLCPNQASSMAKVKVRMFATFREAAGTSGAEIEASSLSELLGLLAERFGPEMARLVSKKDEDSDRLVVLVNGRNRHPGRGRDLPLHDGDEVAIFPPVSGG